MKRTLFTTLLILFLFSTNTFAENFSYTRFDGHSSGVLSVAFSPVDDTLASGSADGTIRLWNFKTGALLKILTGHRGWVYSVAFSPDGKTIASGSYDSTLRLWDAATGEHLNTFTGHSSVVLSVAFSPDGQTLASGSASDEETIRLWDVKTGELLKILTGHSKSVLSVAFSPDGKTIASGSIDGTLRLWDPNTGVNFKTLLGYREVYSVAFRPDGKTIASGSGDWVSAILLHDINTGDERLDPLTGHEWEVNSVAFSPGGQVLASGSQDNTIRLWDANTGEHLDTLTGHGGDVNSVAFSSDGLLASASDDRTILIWDVTTNSVVQSLAGHSDSIVSVAFRPDGKTIVSASDQSSRLWDANTGGHLKSLSVRSVYGIALSPNGKTLASASRGSIHLQDINTGDELMDPLKGHGGDVYSVAFSPDGQVLASGSDDKTIRLWDTSTGAHLNTLTGHTRSVNSVVFSPKGQILASGSDDKTIRIWNAATGNELLGPLTGHEYAVNSVALSTNGEILASGSDDQTIRIWDAATGAHLNTLTGHTHSVNSVALSPDGKTIASGSSDATIRLWDVATGGLLKTLTGHDNRVNSVAFSPDGQTLASGGGDRTLRLWDLPTTRVTISPNPVVPPAIGEQFTLNIGIVAGSNIFGYGFSVGFDPAVLRFVGSANGDYIPGTFSVEPIVSDNTVTLATTASTAWGNGNGTLATITFEVVEVTESIITLFDVSLSDTAERLVPSFEDSAYIEPAIMPAAGVVRLTPESIDSPAIGEQLTFNVDIAGGQDSISFQPYFHYDTAALEYISYTSGDYISNGGTGEGTLGTVTFEVLNVQNSTVDVSGYFTAPNGLRFAPTFVGARVIVPIFGDVNKDGVVNILDLVVVASSFGQSVSEAGNPADVNEDGVINIIDLVKVAGAFGGAPAAPLALSENLPGSPTRTEVQQWLTQARQANLTDAISQRGIRFLEQLLAALTPKKTALLPNYPNPFNPETWIPYQLANPAEVSISIYAIDGKLVRALDLGHQPIGIYESKSRAAYWDGRNAVGEPVASGVYFYTLKAGDFAATRKMLIRK